MAHWLFAVALVTVTTTAAAGPWTRDQGDFYIKVGESIFTADSFRDRSGLTIEGVDYLGATTLTYFEVGLGAGFQVVGMVPYVLARNRFEDGNRFRRGGGGDANLGIQYSPPLAFPLAVRVDAKLPLYDVTGPGGPLAERFPAAGDGQLDITTWVSAGGSVPGWPAYGYGELGYRARTSVFIGGDGPNYGDSLALFGQTGFIFLERWLIALNLSGVIALSDDAVTKSYVSIGPALLVRIIHGLALEASFDPVVYARNASAGLGVSFGLSWSRTRE